jgi:hypothetical protein
VVTARGGGGIQRLGEAVGAAVAGAALGGLVAWPLGAAPVGAAVGGINGAISGWRGIYEWHSGRGVGAFVLDSTWALATTAAGLLIHGVNSATRRAGYAVELSRRANRHVYRKGFQVRRGFAITWGNVVNGAGQIDGDTAYNARRRRLVTDHEDVHVWQARILGPLYPVSYLGWMVGAGAAGAVRWAVKRDGPFAKSVEAWAYYANPFEWWAYSRDGNWPPSHVDGRLVWKRPMLSPKSKRPVVVEQSTGG